MIQKKSHAVKHLKIYPDVNTKKSICIPKTCARKNGKFATEWDVRPFLAFMKKLVGDQKSNQERKFLRDDRYIKI